MSTLPVSTPPWQERFVVDHALGALAVENLLAGFFDAWADERYASAGGYLIGLASVLGDDQWRWYDARRILYEKDLDKRDAIIKDAHKTWAFIER